MQELFLKIATFVFAHKKWKNFVRRGLDKRKTRSREGRFGASFAAL